MKRTHLAIAIVGIAITLAAEIPACHRIVFRAVHRHHSKATLASWEEWNKTHVPPKPKEILAELDFACPPVDLAQIDTGDFIPKVDAPEWEPVDVNTQRNPLDDRTVTIKFDGDSGSVEVIDDDFAPFIPFGAYASPPPVPEPWTFGMVGLGIIAMILNLEAKSE